MVTATIPLPIAKRAEQIATLVETIALNEYIPHAPTPKQLKFLALDELEALYGGAAGGGKSDCLLMAALQYVHIPSYAAIVFRRTYTDLALPGALMDRAHEWLDDTQATWSEARKRWSFPSGASVSFGYMETDRDRYRYSGPAFQFCGFDELTEFTERCYRFLFSRLRRLKGASVPLRMRSASNPGGSGHDWVKARFVDSDRVPFHPAHIRDNPFIDAVEYEMALDQLDPITRAQLLSGDWSARAVGGMFRREWFRLVDDWPRDAMLLRYWDLAATAPKKGGDPDWTAGALVAVKDGQAWLVDMRRMRGTPGEVEALVKQTAELDGRDVPIRMEQEPGSSGVNTIDSYTRGALFGYTFQGDRVTGSKPVRARPLSSAAQAGNVHLVSGPWIVDLLDEAEAFPNSAHDDQIDAMSGAFNALAHAPIDFVV